MSECRFVARSLGRAASPRPPRSKTQNLNFGTADGPRRPIVRLRLESLNRRIRDDPPYLGFMFQAALADLA